jgi:hypothetical protein
MKKYYLIFILISLCFVKSVAQDNKKADNAHWDKVMLTKNPEEVKGLQRIGEIDSKAQKVFGSQTSLRKKAREEMKKNSPINNVYISGVAYKEKEDNSEKAE